MEDVCFSRLLCVLWTTNKKRMVWADSEITHPSSYRPARNTTPSFGQTPLCYRTTCTRIHTIFDTAHEGRTFTCFMAYVYLCGWLRPLRYSRAFSSSSVQQCVWRYLCLLYFFHKKLDSTKMQKQQYLHSTQNSTQKVDSFRVYVRQHFEL